jgi:hypothetical protein
MSDSSQAVRKDVMARISTLLSAVPLLYVEEMSLPKSVNGMRFARRFLLTNGNWQREVQVKILTDGQPKTIKQTALEWYSNYPRLNGTSPYLILGVPYLSERGIAVCKELEVGCIDVAGNCYMRFDAAYIEVSGKPNLKPESRNEVSIFSPKSSRVARVLLSNVHKSWGVQEIATTADISMGLASRIKTRLVEQGLAEEVNHRVRASEPQQLLAAWLEHYTYRKNRIREFYTLDNPADAERLLGEYCRSANLPCALGLFSGAARVAPHVRTNKAFIFVAGDLDEVAKDLEWKHVTSGANVMLLSPYDSGVFLFDRTIQHLNVVSDVQLYLDLKTHKGRGEEAAEFLFRATIQPKWQHEVNTDR